MKSTVTSLDKWFLIRRNPPSRGTARQSGSVGHHKSKLNPSSALFYSPRISFGFVVSHLKTFLFFLFLFLCIVLHFFRLCICRISELDSLYFVLFFIFNGSLSKSVHSAWWHQLMRTDSLKNLTEVWQPVFSDGLSRIRVGFLFVSQISRPNLTSRNTFCHNATYGNKF